MIIGLIYGGTIATGNTRVRFSQQWWSSAAAECLFNVKSLAAIMKGR